MADKTLPLSIDKIMDLLSYEDDLYFSAAEKERLIHTAPIAKKIQKLSPPTELLPPLSTTSKKENKVFFKEAILVVEDEKKNVFWKNLSIALSNYFASTLTVSGDDLVRSDLTATKVLIAERSFLQKKKIQPFVRHIPQENRYFFRDIPIVLLEDQFYKKDPIQKKKIWQMLCQKIPSMLA